MVWSARGASNQEGRTRANERAVEIVGPHEADLRLELPGFCLLPDQWMRKNEAHLPAEAEGGNPGKYSSESPEGLGGRQDGP